MLSKCKMITEAKLSKKEKKCMGYINTCHTLKRKQTSNDYYLKITRFGKPYSINSEGSFNHSIIFQTAIAPVINNNTIATVLITSFDGIIVFDPLSRYTAFDLKGFKLIIEL